MTKSFADTCLERAEKATPGPWKYKSEGDDDKGCHWIETKEEMKQILLTWHWDEQKELQQLTSLNGWNSEYEPDDMEFIAASREMVPELCRRLKRACKFLKEDATHWDNEGNEEQALEINQLAAALEAMPGDK